MINYSNISIQHRENFEDYLKKTGYSHSFLKGESFGIAKEVSITDKIKVGKLVDAILTEPESIDKYDMLDSLYPIAKEIAFKIKSQFGELIKHFESQISFTADVEYQGFTMPTKGRMDYLLKDISVIDLKVTFVKDVKALIDFMRYDNQLWHYAKAMNVQQAYLLIYSVPLKKAQLIQIDVSSDYNEFWADKTLKFGYVKL